MNNETLTVEKDKVLAAMEKCPTFKTIAETLWPGLAEKPHKFKVGDRVTYRCQGYGPDGQSGTVKIIKGRNDQPYGVGFDEAFSGHTIDGFCKDGHGWWCDEDYLSPEEKWEDVTDRLEVIPGWICSEPNAVVVGMKGSTSGGNFIIVVNPRVPCGGGYKIENGRAYHRVTP